MKKNVVILITFFLFPLLANGADYAKIQSIDSVQVVKIAPQDKRAIIKTPDGQMRIIQAGEVLQDENKTTSTPGLRVDDIYTNNVVIIEKKSGIISTVVFTLENGGQRVERR
jgi:hypothetical protein